MNKLFTAFMAIVLVACCVISFTTCSKDYSFEGGVSAGGASGTAMYSFNNAAGLCSGSTLSGKYYVNTALASGNSVQLQANVTSIGSYVLSTSAINGIVFSGIGNFTDTGIQIITLTANGTPLSQGNFIFSVPAPTGTGCFFSVVTEKAPVVKASFTLLGAPGNCSGAIIDGSYFPGAKMDEFNTIEIAVNVTSVGAFTLSTDTLDGISFSASGSFTSIGNQTVKLKGAGTPDFARKITFTPAVAGSSCTCNIVVVNREPLATYVLESGSGSPNPCIYTLSGTYNVNKPLSISNAVSITVFVTVLGNFTIATQSVNGITFAYSGTFTNLGAQKVTLQGEGIPTIPGSFSFIPEIIGPHPLGGESCGFEILVN